MTTPGHDKDQAATDRLGPGGPSRVDAEKVRAQMRRWQDCVLDLTKSNPLIGLNRSRVAQLRVTAPPAGELFRLLVLDEAKLRMPLVKRLRPSAGQQRLLSDDREQEELGLEPGDVTFDAEPLALMRRLRRICDNARTTVEERGVTTLYLTFGALWWQDDKFGASVSPLWMVPCDLTRKGPDAPLRLSVADEEMQLNPALEYYLRQWHKVTLPAVPEEPDAQSPSRFLDQVRGEVEELHWQVTDEVWLSTFSFESLVIYKDLGALTEAAGSNAVVAGLARAAPPAGRSEALPDDLESLPTPAVVPIPVLPTDSSQLETLIHAASGKHVVVHGPPGTGKSQTIANLIADALSRNWKVLFVSAKMAALNVVHDRLKELGLERFCLEAHSTKAGKAKIIDELRRTLEAETVPEPARLSEELESLLRTREKLNSYVRVLHQRIEPLGLSVYQGIGRLAKLHRAAEVRASLPWANPLDASRADLEACGEFLDQLGRMAEVFDRRNEHPWRGFAPPDPFGVIEQETLQNALETLRRACAVVSRPATILESLIPEARRLSVEEWLGFRQALDGIIKIKNLPDGWWTLDAKDLEAKACLFEEASCLKSEFESKSAELRESSDLPPAELQERLEPAEGPLGKWYAIIRPRSWKWRREVKAALKAGARRGRRALRELLATCRRMCEIASWFEENNPELSRYVRPHATLLEVSEAFRAAAALRRGLDAAGRSPKPSTTTLSLDVRTVAEALLATLPPNNEALNAALSLVDRLWPGGFTESLSACRAAVPAVAGRSAELLGAFPRLREWVLVRRIVSKCAQRGLEPFLASLGSITAREARRAFERRFCTLWVDAAGQRYPELRDFSATRQEDLIHRFRHLDQEVRRLAIQGAQAVASSAAHRVQAAQDHAGTATEVGILRHELQKKKRIKPLRRLFAEIPHVLQALKPCLLMSPISVSTYLKPDAFRFDLAVFDEASQLPTAEAVPAILRAQQVVVAGDANQLPPTSFFEAALLPEDDEDEDTETSPPPLESLLDDCVAIVPVFQEAHLRWHYRSLDERLIRFSNHFFYDNRLITFPAPMPGASEQGVRLVYVPDGVYDRGRSRTNRKEARAVARLVIEHFDRHPERSLGVVALNLSQKDAIEDAVAEELESRPDLGPLIDPSRPEKFFVKSLENVQGDERDTMIISVGYGKDADGGLTYNFGPINQHGGWRRLNVLVTRSKWECVLVTSLRAGELSGVNPNNRGAVALRNFIEYAERNARVPAPAPVITSGETNDFEDAVQEALVERRFSLDAQVGAGKYRIDLAVRGQSDPNRYVLGIECDGATYHSSRTARDRDLLRQQVLQRRGWRIHRVWSTEWFHDRDRALASLLRSIEDAEQAARLGEAPLLAVPSGSEADPDPPGPGRTARPPVAPTRRHLAGEPYRRVKSGPRRAREHLLDSRYTGRLADTVCLVVIAEGPICSELLVDRVKELHGVERAGSNVQANIHSAIQYAIRCRGIEALQAGQFLRIRGQTLSKFRVPAEGVNRTIEQIPEEEIGLAILHLVEDQFGVSEEHLPQAVARLLGVERLQAEGGDKIRDALQDLVHRCLLRVSGTQVHLA